jgi:SAM-dependent methyltransferase
MEFVANGKGRAVDKGGDRGCSFRMSNDSHEAAVPSLRQDDEAARLARVWSSQGRAHLDSYLVQEAENPCFNPQSVLVRALVADRLVPEGCAELIGEELYYAACCSFGVLGNREGWFPRLLSLLQAEPNSERLPEFLRSDFEREQNSTIDLLALFKKLGGALAAGFDGFRSPFEDRWKEARSMADAGSRFSMLELACGSANDYRYLDAFGLASGVDYTGVDICPENIENASFRFPEVDFRVGDAMALAFGDREFDVVCAFDLFEHLSAEGLESALAEAVRVCRSELWLSFFNLADIPCHEIRPVEQYHWNLLSSGEVVASLNRLGCSVEIVSIPDELGGRFPGYRHYNGEARMVIATVG